MVRSRLSALIGVVLGMGALLTATPLHAQQTRLLFDDGGLFSGPKMSIIQPTDSSARVPPDTAAARADELVHVRYQPEGDWTLSDDATETARQVLLLQDSVAVPPEEVALQRSGDSIAAVRAGYPREEIDWLTPVTFGHEIDTSATLSLPEVYAADYPRLRGPYDRGRRLIDEGKPYRALDTLSVFYGEVTPAFSFVPEAKAALDAAAEAAAAQDADSFQTLRRQVVSSPTAETLGRLKAFQSDLDSTRAALASYFDKRPEASTSVRDRLDNLKSSATSLYDNAYETYRQQTIRVFFQKPYTRPKPALFVDVLARLLLVPEPAMAAAQPQLDSLPRQSLDKPRFAEARRTLQDEGWRAEFSDVLTVVENNLQEDDRIFEKEVMRSLRLQRTSAAQPYYEILAALNALAGGDREGFRENWTRALTTCTDLDLLSTMQHWAVAGQTSSQSVPADVLSLMEEAERLRTEGQSTAALQPLDEAFGLTAEYSPLLYELGRAGLAQGDTAAAQANFERARTLDADYTTPRVASLRLLLDRGQYETALSRADTTLHSEPYWLVYFAKARALVALERYGEAIEVLRGRCEQLNDQSRALYTLMAELYVGRGAWDGVPWAVGQAEKYPPQRSAFERRLQAVRDTVRATEEASLQEDGTDPGAAAGP